MANRRSGVLLRHLRRLTAGPADVARSDRELLERFAACQEEAAFEALVRRHGPLVLGVCRRVLLQEQDAEDAFQATFLILARKAAAPGWKESIGNWLYRVAYRVAVRARRQAARRQARERRPADRPPNDPLAEVTLREAQRVLDDELSRLPERLRAPLVLCCLGGRTRDEAARQLGWSVATLKRRLERGRQLLALRLRRRGLTVPALLAGLTFSEGAASAAVPGALLTSTVTAALPPASAAAPGLISAQAASLVRETSRVLLLSKCKAALGWVLAAVVAAGLGAAGVRQPSSADRPAEAQAGSPAPPGEEPHPARTDRLGDPLPPGALFRLGSVRLRHKTGIHSVAFVAGGRFLAAAGDDKVIRFWDPVTGKERWQSKGLGATACSPDGKTLATFEGNDIALWDVATGKRLRRLPRRAGSLEWPFVSLLFAPDGRTLAAVDGKRSASLWDVATGRERIHLPAQEKPIVCLGFAPDGKSLLTAVGNRQEDIVLRRWDPDTGREVRAVRIPAPGPKAWLRPLAFSPDGKTIALEEVAEARRKEGRITHVFTECRLYLADAATGREQRRLEADSSVIWAAAFAPDSRLVACQRMDGGVGVWDTATGGRRFVQRGYPGGSRVDGSTLAFTPDGKRLATVGNSGAVHLWDVATGRELLANPEAHHAAVTCVAFAPGGRVVATGSGDHTIRLWDTATGRQRLRLAGHADPVRALAFSRDGRALASAGMDDTVRVWDPATGKERHTFKEERKPRGSYIMNYGVHALVFLPDGRTLVSWGEDQMLRMWDLAAGKERSARQVRLQGLPEPPAKPGKTSEEFFFGDHVHWAAFTPDGTTAVLASDKAVHLVDVARGQEVFQLPSPLRRFFPAALSADGQTLVTGCLDKSIRLFELATGQEVLRATLPDAPTTAAFAPDGSRVALGIHGGAIHILDVAGGKERVTLTGQNARIDSLAFRPDGKMLASGLSDTTALLWGVATASPRPRKEELTPATLNALWGDLAGADAAKAHTAAWTLAANPEAAVALLDQRLRAAPPIDPQHIQALIADLDHKEFARREKAARELKRLGAAAEAALRAVRERPPSLEVRRRVEALLETPPPWSPPDADALRRTRAIPVLERIGSPAAGAVLERLARGAPTARETRLAEAARGRLAERAR